MPLYIRDKKYKVMLNGQAYNLIMPNIKYEFKPGVIADEGGTLVENAVIATYYIYEDAAAYDKDGILEEYRLDDHFIAYAYQENSDGLLVPVLYKTDVEDTYDWGPTDPDYEEEFYYVGTQKVGDNTYDKWRKINNNQGPYWDEPGRIYVLTNRVVEITSIN